jgi:hypothetical protein
MDVGKEDEDDEARPSTTLLESLQRGQEESSKKGQRFAARIVT